MVITDKKIRELAVNHGLITPFKEENLQSESYDVTIGEKVITFSKEIRCLDITDKKDVSDIYNEIELTEDGFIISPGEYILVSLSEDIKLPDNMSAHIRPKTRFTRLGLLVSAQHCNSSYEGNLKLGVLNAGCYPVRIHKGFPIAQIVFEELEQVPSEHKLYRNKENAAYQKESDFRGAKFDDIVDKIYAKMME